LILQKSKDSFRSAAADHQKSASARVTLLLVLLCACVLTSFCLSAGHSCSARPTSSENLEAEKPDGSEGSLQTEIEIDRTESSEPNIPQSAEVSQLTVDPQRQIEAAFELIYQGKFEDAGELIEQIKENNPAELIPPVTDQLAEIIINKYQALSKQRQSARQQAYKQQLDELEKLQAAMCASDVNDLTSIADINDVNDVNDITEGLSVIAKAGELANDAQRKELLARPFTKQVFQKAIDKAAEFEVQGKWLDAYTVCYAWLQAIDPNNKAYSDYADQLLDKAGILISFQDSPCESRQERFQGVEKKMFIQAVDALDRHYVSTIDYSQMAVEAIKRCQLLGEVMATWDPNIDENAPFSLNLPDEDPKFMTGQESSGSSAGFSRLDPNELATFSAALSMELNEIESASEPAKGGLDPAQGFAVPSGFKKGEFIDVFERILAVNEATIQFSRTALIAQFAEAALAALDPYTVMVWPSQVRDFEKLMTKEFTGIGIEITKQKGLLTVSSLLPGTPAYRSGLDAGDVIVAVDGLETKNMSLMCAVHKITGPKGTKVTLTIKREGQQDTKDINITRAKINVESIRGWERTRTGKWLYMVDQQNKIGYVRVTECIASTSFELEQVLNELEENGLKGLILDLRFNAGGFLETAVDVADKFIKQGLIVRTQPGFGRTPTYKAAHKSRTHPNYPLVVLINSSTASGAEIVAGALADEKHNRAILVGQRTHGKGLVQGIMHFRRTGAQLKYTMAYYHLPSGQRVKSRDEAEKTGTKDWGIEPDVEIKLTNDELRKLIAVQRDNDVLVQADRSQGQETPEKHTIEELLEADPQLSVGYMIVRAKLIQERMQNTEF
jgi:carboxyl-terminal processing protease